jgi:hypothetical protein
MTRILVLSLASCGWLIVSVAHADDKAEKQQQSVAKGLEYLVKQQDAAGFWAAQGGQYKVVMTAMSGQALLMAGSTPSAGPYQKHLQSSVAWLRAQAQQDGLIGNPNNVADAQRYMFGHATAIIFLASVYERENNADSRKQLEELLTKALQFTAKAQTSRGGWGYVSAQDGSDFDEGCTTAFQVQSLRAASLAGIKLDKDMVKKAQDYLQTATNNDGGIVYSLVNANQVGRPALTVHALAGVFTVNDFNTDLAKKWLQYSQSNVKWDEAPSKSTYGMWFYMQVPLAQALHALGDNGYAKLFPDSKESERLTWSKYKDKVFTHLVDEQAQDGSWGDKIVGPIYGTTSALSILQLDKSRLKIHQP